jgi:hypothetical protein
VSRRHHAELEPDRLRLQFLAKEKALAEQLREKDLFGHLEEQVATVFGRKLALSIEIVENGGAPEGEVPVQPAAEQGVGERAKQDPLVQRFVETFQGEVEDVTSIHRSQPQ